MYTRCGTILLFGVVMASVGCQPTKTSLKTYPVKGKVLFKSDDKPVTNGMVEFRPKDGSVGANGFATLGPDGSFVIQTIVENTKLDGVPDGNYQVTVTLTGYGSDPQAVFPVVLTTPYVVKPDASNDFTIKIDRPRK